MKTSIITTYSFSIEDLKLLKQPSPNYPCNNCESRYNGCTCEEKSSYDKNIRPYKDNDLVYIANILKCAQESLSQIKDEIGEFLANVDVLKDYCKYSEGNIDSSDLSELIKLSQNYSDIMESKSFDAKLFYFFLDCLGINESNYKNLENILNWNKNKKD